MTHLDFSPLYRSTVGFDRLARLMDSALTEPARTPSWPPYDIEVTGENRYRITMAVAGFSREDLKLEVREQALTVTAERPHEEAREYLHRGIARRGFNQSFRLADHVKVTGADLENGLLTINLERELPESMKPRTIEIGIGTTAPKLVDAAA
ncbi:MAG: Hsp20 family protein [Nitrospirota bacterium]|nr:Hsp20 family protein [Nitrospirota bacterium]